MPASRESVANSLQKEDSPFDDGRTRGGGRELAAVAVLFALSELAVLVTYARIEPEQLYHVSRGGLAADSAGRSST